jgi:osmotically-inducible protein OsmY
VSELESLEPRPELPGRALKIGIFGVVALGAVASGFILSRQGRRVMREAWQGRRRTRLEDRVLEMLWEDDLVGRRPLDVEELSPGVIAVSGQLRSRREREHLLDLVEDLEGVRDVEDRLTVARKPPTPLHRTRARARARVRARRRRERERRD